jgi:hypothetical protein
MKKCTYCGKEYPNSATVCAVDQQSLVSDDESLMAEAASVAPSLNPPTASAPVVLAKPALMVRLRQWHLYLGCVFAPMLLYFAISGIWQTIGFRSAILDLLSSIHKSQGLKNGHSLSSPLMIIFVLLMAVCFIFTTILGIMMAVKYGRNRRVAYGCLAFGIVFPLLLIVIELL